MEPRSRLDLKDARRLPSLLVIVTFSPFQAFGGGQAHKFGEIDGHAGIP